MRYYSDPTATRALGSINREFSRQEKIARPLCRLYLQGKLSPQDWEAAHTRFVGIYKHVLDNTLQKMQQEQERK